MAHWKLFQPMCLHKNCRRFLGLKQYALPRDITSALNRYMRGLRESEIQPEILLQISMMNFKDVKMLHGNFYGNMICDRDVLHLPSSLIMEYNDEDDYTHIAMEQMDFLWNAFGLDRCRYKDFEEIRENA